MDKKPRKNFNEPQAGRDPQWLRSEKESPEIKISVQSIENIIFEVEKPVKIVVLSVWEEENDKLSENGIDVMPDDAQEIKAGLLGKKINKLVYGSSW